MNNPLSVCVSGHIKEYDRYSYDTMYDIFSSIFGEDVEYPDIISYDDQKIHIIYFGYSDSKSTETPILVRDIDGHWGIVYNVSLIKDKRSNDSVISFKKLSEINKIMELFGIESSDIIFQTYTGDSFRFIK